MTGAPQTEDRAPISAASLFDARFIADPYPGFAALRTAAPVHRLTLPDGANVWLVTRYADVRAGLADSRLSLDKANSTDGWKGFSLPPALDANLLNMDPPDHTRIRRLVRHAFGPQRIARLRPKIEAAAERLLDRITPAGRADLVAEYAGPLPVTVISDLLGVPEADRAALRGWTDVMLAPPTDDARSAGRAVLAIQDLLVRLIADKRRNPGDDLLTAMIAARDTGADDAARGVDGAASGAPDGPGPTAGGGAAGAGRHSGADRLSEDELTSLAFLVLFAGYENSVHVIGTGLLALLRNPEQLALVRAGAEPSPAAVEELLRYEPPGTVALRRFAVTDLTIGGVTIPAGATVLLCVAAANRDPERFADPDALDLERPDNAHLTLGHGIHYCVGAPLARLEAQIAIGAVLQRFPKLALAVDPAELAWRPSFRTRGLSSLPVTF
ncbi:cytochrome P450 [Plantactinospora sp. KLBMP9567]|uniref:cytochrome P450 family protein n=1 Tax=Plantactinospora sp. KLBMP9567 TaxID=3085900 RepID=UPI002980E873|nr:cytochrome P450 [Plantactinospora sp. KLBMP9567]MDW5322455.1 cytochrome P450 [Plantactinospora sp. KLBMP9567]